MASDSALTLVNRIFRLTGDYSSVATVIGSPADIAERAIDFLNITLRDLTRTIDFDILHNSFAGTGNGVDSVFASGVVASSPDSAISVTIDANVATEVTRKNLHEIRTVSATSTSYPYYFCRTADATGALAVDIYPIPANGSAITVLSQQDPTEFTVADASVTEITDNDLLVLGAIAHMDAFSGMERGYMQLYEEAKKRLWLQTYEHQEVQISVEDYR